MHNIISDKRKLEGAFVIFILCVIVLCSCNSRLNSFPRSSHVSQQTSFYTQTTEQLPAAPDSCQTSVPTKEMEQLLIIELTTQKIIIENVSDKTIFLELIPTEVLPFIEWSPCDDPENCSNYKLNPKEKRIILISEIIFEETKSITLVWWELEFDKDLNKYRVINRTEKILKLSDY